MDTVVVVKMDPIVVNALDEDPEILIWPADFRWEDRNLVVGPGKEYLAAVMALLNRDEQNCRVLPGPGAEIMESTGGVFSKRKARYIRRNTRGPAMIETTYRDGTGQQSFVVRPDDVYFLDRKYQLVSDFHYREAHKQMFLDAGWGRATRVQNGYTSVWWIEPHNN